MYTLSPGVAGDWRLSAGGVLLPAPVAIRPGMLVDVWADGGAMAPAKAVKVGVFPSYQQVAVRSEALPVVELDHGAVWRRFRPAAATASAPPMLASAALVAGLPADVIGLEALAGAIGYALDAGSLARGPVRGCCGRVGPHACGRYSAVQAARKRRSGYLRSRGRAGCCDAHLRLLDWPAAVGRRGVVSVGRGYDPGGVGQVVDVMRARVAWWRARVDGFERAYLVEALGYELDATDGPAVAVLSARVRGVDAAHWEALAGATWTDGAAEWRVVSASASFEVGPVAVCRFRRVSNVALPLTLGPAAAAGGE